MSEILIVKMNDGNTMTHWRDAQDYHVLDLPAYVAALMKVHHPEKAVVGYAVCNKEKLHEHLKAGKNLDKDLVVVSRREVEKNKLDTIQNIRALSQSPDCICVTNNS